jgi:hypothetical protein
VAVAVSNGRLEGGGRQGGAAAGRVGGGGGSGNGNGDGNGNGGQGCGLGDTGGGGLVGKSVWNSAGFRDYSDSGDFEQQNFHLNFIFPIAKCVSTNSEHISSSSESSPAIDSSNFMNRKTFSLYMSVARGIKI